MLDTVWLVPLLPLVSAIGLMLLGGVLPRTLAAIMGAGSVGLSALIVLLMSVTYLNQAQPQAYEITLWTWMAVAQFTTGISFYVDGLTLVMMSVITGVGFLIHLYSTEFMEEDDDFCRYFAYLNLFVSAMLILVLADNLLLLYLGWEGVGVCSYLLVGFWYRDPANGKAARKAFVVTRVGDTAMILGLILLYVDLGTVNIQGLMTAANTNWVSGDWVAIIATALLLGGAVGKSAQLPLHTWLPDAMAGPTPVSALIHAATMVTAGVYLIARTHGLFLLAPPVLSAVAIIGLLTLLMAAFTALNQHDIKRILAYSTISQIGYMFLALGVGAWSAAVFHLMTHAFFKASLFLGAGAVIHCLHHEHNIFKMGGLRKRLPVVFWSFLIGSAALAALPFTSGFYSKDQILLAAWQQPTLGPWLWAGGLLGAILTAIYSFRLVFVVFYGEVNTKPNKQLGWRMAVPLSILCVLSLVGGFISQPLSSVFPALQAAQAHGMQEIIVEGLGIAMPLIGLGLAWMVYLSKRWSFTALTDSPLGQRLRAFWFSGWGIDRVYDCFLVWPFKASAKLLRSEPVDYAYHFIVKLSVLFHQGLSALQTGRMRWYASCMVLGLIVTLSLLVGF